MTKTLIQKGFNFWDENKRTLKIIGISFVVIFSIKSIGDSIYEKGFYCTQDTIEKRRPGLLESEREEKRVYRQSKLICLEKIHGRGYRNRMSKKYKQKYIDMIEYIKSKDMLGDPLTMESRHWHWALNYLWAAWEFEEKRFPEWSHFNLVEFKEYLRELDQPLNYIEERRRQEYSLDSLP